MEDKQDTKFAWLADTIEDTIDLCIELTELCYPSDMAQMQQRAKTWLQEAFASEGMPRSSEGNDAAQNQLMMDTVLKLLELAFDSQKDVMLLRLREARNGVSPHAIERCVSQFQQASPINGADTEPS